MKKPVRKTDAEYQKAYRARMRDKQKQHERLAVEAMRIVSAVRLGSKRGRKFAKACDTGDTLQVLLNVRQNLTM
jgi:hypothetical protein